MSTPTLTAGNVLVKIKAAGVNPTDWKIREGYMQQMIPIHFGGEAREALD